jgi:hypothetical protein
MFIVFQVILWIGILKLLVQTDNAFLCALLYTLGTLGLGVLFRLPPLELLLVTALAFGFSFGWFLLLVRIPTGTVWWLLLIGGIILSALIPLALARLIPVEEAPFAPEVAAQRRSTCPQVDARSGATVARSRAAGRSEEPPI